MTKAIRARTVGLSVAFMSLGCDRGDPREGVRGIDGLQNAHADIPIVAVTEEVFAVGGTTGTPWASFTHVTDAIFDVNGALVLLDNIQRRVVVVAEDGSFRHEIDQVGDGPGEFRGPASLTAMSGGRLAIYDIGHLSFLVFGSDGEFIEQFRVSRTPWTMGQTIPTDYLIGKDFRALPDGRILAYGDFGVSEKGRAIEALALGSRRDTLFRAWGLPTTSEERTEEAPTDLATSSNQMTVAHWHSIGRPRFAPPLLVDVLSDGRVAIVDSTGYRIKLVSASGAIESVIERPIQPRDVTPEIMQAVRADEERKLADIGGVTTGGATVITSGTVSREMIDALSSRVSESPQQLTFAAQVPVIAAMAVDSQDRFWVSRTGDDGVADGPTDLLASNGDYVGTLAADDVRIPKAFGPGGLMAYVEYDEFDAPLVRVIRLLRFEALEDSSG